MTLYLCADVVAADALSQSVCLDVSDIQVSMNRRISCWHFGSVVMLGS